MKRSSGYTNLNINDYIVRHDNMQLVYSRTETRLGGHVSILKVLNSKGSQVRRFSIPTVLKAKVLKSEGSQVQRFLSPKINSQMIYL